MKTSKKELKNYAERNKAYYFTGNVYSYENVVYYLRRLCYETESNKVDYENEIEKTINRVMENTSTAYYENAIDIIEKIKFAVHDDFSIEQELYSAGIYGNNGQLHSIKLYNKGIITALLYVYY